MMRQCGRRSQACCNQLAQHNHRMGDVPNRPPVLDLSSPAGRTSCSSSPREPSTAPGIAETDAGGPSRYVLPKDLHGAISHLDDQQLDRLLTAALEERSRRKKPPVAEQDQRKRHSAAVVLALPQGKLNAIRAAFKAGITPSRIAREFGISQQDVRSALRSDARKQ